MLRYPDSSRVGLGDADDAGSSRDARACEAACDQGLCGEAGHDEEVRGAVMEVDMGYGGLARVDSGEVKKEKADADG